MLKEGAGHHPHSLRDPKPIADFICAKHPAGRASEQPSYMSGRVSRASFYGIENSYRFFPAENRYISPAAGHSLRIASTDIRLASARCKEQSM